MRLRIKILLISSISLSMILLIAYSSIMRPPIVQPIQRVGPPPTPQPNIRLCCVSVVIEIDPLGDCYVQGELQPTNIGAYLKAEFGFRRNLNTVDADVIVTILEGEDVIMSERY